MFKKSIALAVPALAAGALVAASLSGGTVQANSEPQAKQSITKGAKAAKKAVDLTSCTGGAQKKVTDRGLTGYIYTTNTASDTSVPGSTSNFQGPKHGKDVLSVNLSAGAYASNGTGQVKVLLNGTPMAPSDNTEGSYINQTDEYGDFSRNYCARIGKGVHTVRVVYKTNGGSSALYLFDPMIHVEQSD